MKKILILLILLLCCSCSAKREDFYTLSYDDYSLTPGYDKLSFVKLVYDFYYPDTMNGLSSMNEELYLFGRHFADAEFTNYKKKEVDSSNSVLSKIDLFFDENRYYSYKIDDYELSKSVKENCEYFEGEYINRNGKACVIGKMVNDKKNVIILEGDIYGFDQDRIYRITISVE